MKYFLLLIAFVGFASADWDGNWTNIDDLTACKLFLKCCHKAMDGGIPSIPVPDYNPLVIHDFSLNGSVFFLNYSFNIANVLYNMLDYNFTTLTAESYSNPERVAYTYNLYWPKLNLTGDFGFEVSVGFIHQRFKGSYNIVLREVNWSGVFNLTKRGQENVTEHLDDFTLKSETGTVDVTITGLPNAAVYANSFKIGLYALMNHMPGRVAGYLKEKHFNGYWISHPERIDAVIANCKS